VFTAEERERVRAAMLDRARGDPAITAAAITGSAAGGAEDQWSDIDLFLGVADGFDVDGAVGAWTDHLYAELGALHHFELTVPEAIYRAFLLPSCLEVDLGFTPAARFGPRGPSFRLVFGATRPAPSGTATPASHLVGLGWHHVLHARTAIERGRPWLAEYWISAVRDQALSLACLRHGLPAAYLKGVDRLPAEDTAGLEETLVRGVDADELRRALGAVAERFLGELRRSDPDAAGRLAGPVRELSRF
jgi:hypothetical protein